MLLQSTWWGHLFENGSKGICLLDRLIERIYKVQVYALQISLLGMCHFLLYECAFAGIGNAAVINSNLWELLFIDMLLVFLNTCAGYQSESFPNYLQFIPYIALFVSPKWHLDQHSQPSGKHQWKLPWYYITYNLKWLTSIKQILWTTGKDVRKQSIHFWWKYQLMRHYGNQCEGSSIK